MTRFAVRCFVLSALLVAGSAAGYAQTPEHPDATPADNFKVSFITKARTPPALDGKLDDACWKQAEVINDFGSCEYGARRFPGPKTEVRYLWDDRYLYVGITCYEDTPENMARHNRDTEDKSQPVYNRDCVELHINGNNDSATRFQTWFIDTGEKQIFWHYDFGWGLLVNESYGLTADWDYASLRGPDYWQIEGRLALADIQIQPRVGYIFGMNAARFRFNKSGTRDDGMKSDEITQFLTWANQGGDHSDVRAFAKCILVDQEPASVAGGLKLAFPDLDKRSIMVQTGSGFDVFDHGKESKLSYIEKLKEELGATQAAAKRLEDSLAIQAPSTVSMKQYADQAKPQFDKLAALARDIGAQSQITVAELNGRRKELGAVRSTVEQQYWVVQRALLLAEGTPRVTVDLKPAVEAPVGLDEPENAPDPRTRETPHVPWATPFVGGKTRALIVVNHAAAWDAYELEHRMDLDADIFYATGDMGTSISPEGDHEHEGMLRFLAKKGQLQRLLAKNYAAYVFLDFSPARLPQDLQYVITQRLLDGAVVVVLQSQDWDFAGLASAKLEKDIMLRESMPYKSMTKLVAAAAPWIDHRGAEIDTLARKSVSLEVPAVSKLKVGKGTYASFSAGGAGYWYTTPLSPQVEQAPDEHFQAEYYCGFAAKIVLDAVGKLPARRMVSISCGDAPLAAGAPVAVSATSVGPAFQGGLRIVTRDQWGKVVSEAKRDVSLPAGTNALALTLPALPAGNYYVDAWLVQGDKVMDWASQRFKVQGKTTIQSVTLASQTLKPGDRVSAQIVVADAAASATVRAELRDVEGRVLQRQEKVPIKDGHAKVDLPLDRAWNTCEFLDVYADDGGVAQDRTTTTLYFRHPDRDDFTVFTDGADPYRLGTLRQTILRGYGISLFENSGYTDDLLGNGGDMALRYWLSGSANETGGSLASDVYQKDVSNTFRQVTKIGATRNVRFVSTGDDSGVQGDFVENYPNWVMPLVNLFAHKYPPYEVKGVDFFTKRGLPNHGEYWRWLWNADLKGILAMKLQPGDFELFIQAFKETYPTIAAFNRANGTSFASFDSIKPEDLAKINPPYVPDVMGFQDWLQKKYKTIDKLNDAWGSSEKSFETIPAAVLVPKLTAEGKYTAALDKPEYLEDLFIRHMQSAATGVHSIDPTAGVGQGAASFDNVIPEVLEFTDTFAPYLADVNIEIGRSMPHKWVGQTIGIYGGKFIKVSERRHQAWHVLFTGGNFIWFWSACTGGLMGDLSTNPNRSGAMLDTIREIQQGIGACLLRSQRQDDGIAILHSRASGHMSGVVKEMSTQGDSETAFQHILKDLGVQFRYVSTRQVEDGALRGGALKTLVLPYTQTLTPKEVSEVEAFVKGGGSIVADLRAGTFSPDGKPLKAGVLDDLFGITRSGPRAKPVRGSLAISGLLPEPCAIDGFQADASVTAGTAKPYGRIGEAPALLVNDAGKGKAVLLNVGASAYEFLLSRDALGKGRDAFRKVFEQAGVKSRFRVTAGGKEVPGVEMAVFKRGAAKYLAVEKRSFEYEKYPIQAEIALDGKYYVTDLHSGKSLGQTDRVPIQLEGLGCYVFSLLPYKVEGLVITAPKSVKGGEDLKLEIALKTSAPPAPHVVRVDVTSPSGARPLEMRKIDTKDGKATCVLPIALNDESGNWTVTATDVSSGLSQTARVEVLRP